MELVKQELILRENIDSIDIIEKQYIRELSCEIVREKYIASYGDCVVAKGSSEEWWSIIHVGNCSSGRFRKIKEDSKTLNFSQLYGKYSCDRFDPLNPLVIELNSISSFQTSRVIVERETE